MIMSWYFIPWTIQYLLGGLIAVLITFFVFKKNPKNLAYQRFLLFGICTFVWMFAVFFARNAPSASISFQIYRIIQVCFMLSLPLLLLTLISLQKTKRIFILTLVPGLSIGLLISALTLYNVAWGKYGWSYSISPIASIIGFPILFGYFIGIIATGCFLMKKSLHHSLAMKYKLIVIGCIIYFVPLTITNVLMWSQSETPPFGGFLLTIEFLFIAYAITLPIEKIEIVKPTKLTEFYCVFLNRLQNVIPGKELGNSALKFAHYIEAMGLKDIVVFEGGQLVFDSDKFAEEEIGDVADTVLRTLKGLPELKDTVEQYTNVFIETYKTMMLISKNGADKWLEQMLHTHGGFLYQQGILDTMPEEIELPPIFTEMQPGKVYLFKEKQPKEAYSKLKEALNWGFECLCVTKLHPQKVRERYGVEKASVIWLTFKASNTVKTINPRHLDEFSKTISKFVKTTSRSAILIDCFWEIVMVNGFERAESFLKGVKEVCKENNSNLLISLNREVFEEKQMAVMEKEMDEVK